ncbi:hypothetical protein SE17_30115 [Kouleothrix aurantiaca]|uniref:ABC transporter Uup C-terminal domain-containing protein n=1 Tax=Kouleothrix aurantiaca TaxID=186479 RepID=A0A0P9CWC4_9CHLR|nr:hypothetical protein SE17_30115 [Kouleothrix aurantiaca]
MAGNLLVLDEPTNHLDINAREALEVVLNEYNGSILFVSHDRYFIDAVADTIWMVQDATVQAFAGTYSEFVEARDARERAAAEPKAEQNGKGKTAPAPSNGKTAPAAPAPAPSPAAAPVVAAPANGIASPIDRNAEREQRQRQRRLSALEGEIAMLEEELKKMGDEMTAASVASDGKRVTALELQYADVQEMLNTRYEEWSAAAG